MILRRWLKKSCQTMDQTYHDPVLLQESVNGLAIEPDGVYVDVTFGGGGHSREILSRLGQQGKLYAFDQDPDAQRNVIDDPRFTLIPENFRYMRRFLRLHGVRQVDGILADFGVSSHQFNEASRGFSIRFDADLDMRMNHKAGKTARELINKLPEQRIAQILYDYADLRSAPKMARTIVAARKEQEIKTSEDLKQVLSSFLPQHRENKVLAQVFQALRIEVNDELEVIREFLEQCNQVLKDGARLSVISYHSLEDRMVKRWMRDGQLEGKPETDLFGRVQLPYKKVGGLIVPGEQELARNNRSRSARLRIATRTIHD